MICEFSSLTAQKALAGEIADAVSRIIRDVAVPKPSRAAELYAALTLSIVLLRERYDATKHEPETKTFDLNQRLEIIVHELGVIEGKRIKLEETLQAGSA